MGVIYLLTVCCGDHNKYYIGQSKSGLSSRIKSHKHRLSKEKSYNRKLLECYQKYGWGSFNFKVLEECEDNQLHNREQFYIDKYKTFENDYGLNLTSGGEFGKKLSKESREKISNIHKGRFVNEEWKDKLKIKRRGRTPSLGLIHTEETRNKIATSQGVIKFKLENVKTNEIVEGFNKTLIAERIGIYRKSITKLMKNKNLIIKDWRAI